MKIQLWILAIKYQPMEVRLISSKTKWIWIYERDIFCHKRLKKPYKTIKGHVGQTMPWKATIKNPWLITFCHSVALFVHFSRFSIANRVFFRFVTIIVCLEQILLANIFCSIWNVFCSCFHSKKNSNNSKKASFRTFELSSRCKSPNKRAV